MGVLHFCARHILQLTIASAAIAGVHWWYHTPSHAAELTAGYFNTSTRNGYTALATTCAAFGASLVLTCVEMADAQHPPAAACGPQALLKQVRATAYTAGVPLSGALAVLRLSSRRSCIAAATSLTCAAVYGAWRPATRPQGQEQTCRSVTACIFCSAHSNDVALAHTPLHSFRP